MKKILFASALCLVSTAAFADDSCFELSKDGKTWSKTPELLCVSQVKDADYTLSLKTGMPGSQQEVVTLHLNLTLRAKCIDCNKDTFALANPTNSIINQLSVTFDGKRDAKTMEEKGSLKIGATKFFYRKPGAAAAATPPAKPTAPATTPPAKTAPPATTPPTTTPPAKK
jgi:hypothetical protein